jgi:hypothetical protein
VTQFSATVDEKTPPPSDGQADHVVDAHAKEIIGGGASKLQEPTSTTQPLFEFKLKALTIDTLREIPVVMLASGILQGRLIFATFDFRWFIDFRERPGIYAQTA